VSSVTARLLKYLGSNEGQDNPSVDPAGRANRPEPTFRASLPELRSAVATPTWWLGLVFHASILAVSWGAIHELILRREADETFVSSVFFGFALAVGQTLREPWRRMTAEPLNDLSTQQARQARLASVRGPIPRDPQVRAAAARLAARPSSPARMAGFVSMTLVILVLSIVLAIEGTAAWWTATAVIGVAVALEPAFRRARRIRLTQLSTPPVP
jgi:hypothetical protein